MAAEQMDQSTTTARGCVLVVEDDASFATHVHAALETAGLHARLFEDIDEHFGRVVADVHPVAVVVDLLVPTAEALRLGRWVMRISSGPVLVVVPGSANPGLPEMMSSRLRVLRRPIAADHLAKTIVELASAIGPIRS